MKPIGSKSQNRNRPGMLAASRGRSYLRRGLALCICLCLTQLARVGLAFDPPIASDSSTLIHVKVTSTDSITLARQLSARGFDVLDGSVESGSLELIVSNSSLDILNGMGLAPHRIAVSRPFRKIQAERNEALPGDIPAGYPGLAEILTQMGDAAAAFPSICRLVDLTEEYGTPPTFEGRPMFAVKISDNVDQEEDEPAVLFVSNHHARELVTPVIALHAIEQLTTLYGTDPMIAELVDENEIWIAPTWNPDGYEYVFNVGNFWRKNRRVFPEGVGVDLNRNHVFGWDNDCSGSSDPNFDTYKGPVPGSEPETQTMIAFSNDQHFAKVIDYHSFGRVTVWGYKCLSHPLNTFLVQEAAAISQAHGYGSATSEGGADGQHFQFQLGIRGAYAFLVEIATEFQPSHSSAVDEAVQVFDGIIAVLQRPIPVSGRVSDAMTGEPVAARFTYSGDNVHNCELNPTAGPLGRYHAFVPEGQFTFRFCATGYSPQEHTVVVSAGAGTVLDVELEPDIDAECKESLADCNENFLADACEIFAPAADCNATGILDECELADGTSVDLDGNGVPDECECPPAVPFRDTPPMTNNRFLTVIPGNVGQQTALRVTFVNLPSPFDIWNGAEMWVGPTSAVSENGGAVEPVPEFADFNAATLRCDPYYTDWGAGSVIHVFHEGIVPLGIYQIRAIDDVCDAGIESNFSTPIEIATAAWGDTVEDLSTTPPGPPDGVVQIIDTLAVIGRFGSQPGSIVKARADLFPGCLDMTINITDVLAAVTGFQGLDYPFERTADNPCESMCVSPLP